jgi:hypothetical protein
MVVFEIVFNELAAGARATTIDLLYQTTPTLFPNPFAIGIENETGTDGLSLCTAASPTTWPFGGVRIRLTPSA